MLARFESARVKLERFDAHFKELTGGIRDFLGISTAVARANRSKSTSDQIFFDLILTENIPLGWLAVIGDAVHNARTALDHIAYDIAVPNGGNPTKTMFPFALYRDELDDVIRRYTLNLASPKDLAVIRESRPWKRGNATLWRLHELDILDKHRGLLPCVGSLSVEGAGGITAPLHKFRTGDPLGGISGTPDQVLALGLDKEKDNPIKFDVVLPPGEASEIGHLNAIEELRQIRDSVAKLLGKFD